LAGPAGQPYHLTIANFASIHLSKFVIEISHELYQTISCRSPTGHFTTERGRDLKNARTNSRKFANAGKIIILGVGGSGEMPVMLNDFRQNLRLRGLCADGQCFRTHRAHTTTKAGRQFFQNG